mmetsp:Transcript_69951/g.176250  ORF Transcript_69951/g.176250 Transcript_69951/m.176250 type:complete len:232 (+) Transcript_69951:602-1297(+)
MSVRMTKTCCSLVYAKYSAAVSASLGVTMRSMVGSLAKFMKRTTFSIEPFSSKSFLKKRAVSMLTPMAPKTMLKFSAEWSSTSLPFTSEACLHTCAAISLCGRPAAENSGSFCPRTTEFIVSMALMPVWIISFGYTRDFGFRGAPLMSRNSSAKTAGPLSMGLPEPLKALPMRSSEMGIFNVSPVNSMWQFLLSMLLVPSKTWTIAFFLLTSRIWPWRTEPSARFTLTISP